MLNEIEEFKAYTTFPDYVANNKFDSSYLGRFTFEMLNELMGFSRILTIIARGYMWETEKPDIERARHALWAWCSISDGETASDSKDGRSETNYAILHDEFPELVDETGDGWLCRHVGNIVAFSKSHKEQLSKSSLENILILRKDFSKAWRKKFIQYQIPPFTSSSSGTWLTGIDDSLSEAMEIGPLKDLDFELSQETMAVLKEKTPKGVPEEVLPMLVKYYMTHKEDDSRWVVLPGINVDAYFGKTSFSRKWKNQLPEDIIVWDMGSHYGVSRYYVNLQSVKIEVFDYTKNDENTQEIIMDSDIQKRLKGLVQELCKLPSETEWVEFKCNNKNPQEIGEYISALSNSAVLWNRDNAYLAWGIDNETHEIVGASFDYRKAKKGNEELEAWLARLLNPRVDFRFLNVDYGDKKVVLLEIPAATHRPIAFSGVEYIRVGTNKKPLRDYPEKERRLWLAFEKTPFELRTAKSDVTASEVTELLDCAAYYTLKKLPLPENRDAIIHNMLDEKFISKQDNGNYSISNMGALLFAKDLSGFDALKRKAIRVIRYKGTGRTNAIREQVFTKGYAVQFEDITDYIMTILPQEEEIGGGRRVDHIMFPRKAIREMVGNIMIHQDLMIHGAGPMFEVFDSRVEATSPGSLLVDVDRIIDTAPHSRNENMASFLRIVQICEERGSGFDRMEEGMSENHIPAPKVETSDDFCRTKLYWYDSLNKWSKEEKIRTCYIATCYCYVNEIEVSNAVLRQRFGIDEKNKAIASRIIGDAVKAGMIKLSDPDAVVKMRRYVPYWA